LIVLPKESKKCASRRQCCLKMYLLEDVPSLDNIASSWVALVVDLS
jgi:hypothetical protein